MIDLVSRRQLLTQTTASLAALALARTTRAAPAATVASAPLRLKKALKYTMIGEKLSVADKFKLVKDIGFEGLEVPVRPKGMEDRKTFRQASEAAGLPIHGVLNSSNPDIRTAIELANYLGATSVLIVAGRVNAETAYDVNYAATQKLLREALPLAERYKIKLLVENVWNDFLLSPLEMARYLDELDSPWVGAYFDVGNVVKFGWPEQWVRILGRRIGKLDIKEYSRKKMNDEGMWKGFNVELGEGDVNWPAVRHELAAIGYEGWATAEIKGGDRQRLAEIARRMDQVLALASATS